jgi:hypothetical protein
MSDTFGDKKYTQAEADTAMAPMELDLTALFSVMRDDMITLADGYRGTPEEYIDEVLSWLDDPLVINESGTEFVTKAKPLQGRVDMQGLKISIENRRGSIRQGVDPDGYEWKVKMYTPYGYIRGTEGTDGDHVDCYVGDNRKSEKVFIIHQKDPVTNKYDEDKVMLGFNTATEAKQAYLKQYDKPGYFMAMREVTMDEFKEMLKKKKGKRLEKNLKAQLYKIARDTMVDYKGAFFNR